MKGVLNVIIRLLLGRWIPRFSDSVIRSTFDPCEGCTRWYECNGVDKDYCPLWEEVDNNGLENHRQRQAV